MSIEQLQDFFLWCMLINTGIYALTAMATLVLRDFMYKVHQRLFGMDEAEVGRSIQTYLGNYKLLITFFNFVPWVVILIIK